MAGDPTFVDTNVLIHAARPSAPEFAVDNAAIDRLRDQDRALWISPQVVREYLAVVTRPQGPAPGLTARQALVEARRLSSVFGLAQEGRLTLDRLLELMGTHPAAGKQVHDAHLVATMLVNGIDTLLTFNGRDFARYADLIRLETP